LTIRAWILATTASVVCAGSSLSFGANAPGKNDIPTIDATPFLGDHYPVRRTSFPGGVTGIADVTYDQIPGFRPLTLDIYLPSSRAKRPLILYIHGGGWTNGHSRQSGAFDDFPKVLASLAARGYTVASVNYRLSSEAPFPAALQDVKSAIKFLRAHEDEYGIDPSKGLVWGGSAGGHLAALTALTCGVMEFEPTTTANASPELARVASQSDCVTAAVTWYGIFDLAMVPSLNGAAAPSPTIKKFLGCTGDVCSKDDLDAASPRHYIKSSSPPFLLVHGSEDKTVDPAQSTHFKEAMEGAGAHADLLLIPAVDHSFVGRTPGATRDASLLALRRTFEFIDGTFKAMAANKVSSKSSTTRPSIPFSVPMPIETR
jgi:acetyl esterase/lipase